LRPTWATRTAPVRKRKGRKGKKKEKKKCAPSFGDLGFYFPTTSLCILRLITYYKKAKEREETDCPLRAGLSTMK
jgi:hypothetical protein